MPIPDNAQHERTARAAAAAALDAQAALGRGDTDISASGAQSAVRSGTTNTTQAGDINRARETFVEPKTGTRKGTTQGQSQTSLPGPNTNPPIGPPFP